MIVIHNLQFDDSLGISPLVLIILLATTFLRQIEGGGGDHHAGKITQFRMNFIA